MAGALLIFHKDESTAHSPVEQRNSRRTNLSTAELDTVKDAVVCSIKPKGLTTKDTALEVVQLP